MATIVGKACLSFLFLTATLFPASIKLKVTSTENAGLLEAGVGQPFLLHVIVENASNTAQYPVIKNVEKYTVRRGGFQMNMVNGNTSSTYSYQIRIDEPGRFVLGPAQITENTGIIESEPLEIIVAQNQKAAEPQKKSDSKAKASFLRLTCNKDTLTVGQRAQCTLTFYTADQLVSLQTIIEPDPSSIQGFTIKNKTGPITGNQIINGTNHRFARWSWDIYPTKSGNLVIPAYAADYNTQTNNNMFAFLFTHNDLKRTYSNTLAITVNPLPAHDRKPMLIGAITQFSAKIEPAHAQVGQGMVLTLSITSDGDFDSLGIFSLVGLPDQFKCYESKHHDEPAKFDPTFTTRTMEYIVQALQPGEYQIPAQEITYFDTHDRVYKTKKTNELSIAISGTAPSQSKKNIKPTNPEIATAIAVDVDDIKPIAQDGSFASQPMRMISWQWFWILISCITIAWLLFLLYLNRQTWLFGISHLKSKTSAYSKARKLIKQAHKSGNYAGFYTIFTDLLAAHYHLEPAALSPEIIEEKLRASGLSEQALQDWKIFYARIAESGFYKQTNDPYWYSNLYEQALYWIDVIEKLPRKEQS